MPRDIREYKFNDLMIEHKSKRLLIPALYQRRYSWQKNKWQTLFEDVLDGVNGNTSGDGHFMSTIILQHAPAKNGIIIVDGQQRLTTLSILAKAILNKTKEIIPSYSTNIDSLTQSLYITERDRGLIKPVQSKIVPLKEDYEQYNYILFGKKKPLVEYDSPTIEAYEWFKNTIQMYLDDIDSLKEKEDFIDLLGWTLLEKMKFVVLTLSEDENARKIFESVNGLSEPLSVGELVKNYTFIGTNDDISEELYEKYWSKLDRDWGSTLEEKENFETFLYYWLSAHGCKPFKKKREPIYSSYKLYLNECLQLGKETTESYSRRLFESLYLYESMLSQGKNIESVNLAKNTFSISIVEESIKFYNRIGIGCPEPRAALIAIKLAPILRDISSDLITKESLKLITNYYIRRSFLRNGTQKSGNNTEFILHSMEYALNYALLQEDENIDMAFIKMLKIKIYDQSVPAGLRWILNEELKVDILFASIKRPIFARMILTEVENFKNKNYDYARTFVSNDYQLEHWMPQKADKEEWPLIDEVSRSEKTEAIGNYTLLTGYQNNLFSNRSLEQKTNLAKEYLNKNKRKDFGVWVIDSVILDTIQQKEWNESSIDKRSLKLFNIIFEEMYLDAEKEYLQNTRKFDTALKTTSAYLWRIPKEGRALIYNGTSDIVVKGIQTSDGKVKLMSISNTKNSSSDDFKYKEERKKMLESAIYNDKIIWQGESEALFPAKALSIALGHLSANLWQEDLAC
jgi:hypothetical protein